MTVRGRPIRRSLLLAAGFAGLALAPAAARDATGAECAALKQALDAFADAAREGDEARVVAAMPPRMVAWLAGQARIDAEAERRSIVAQLSAAYEAGRRDSITFDLDGAVFGSLRDGTPYATVPMRGEVTGPVHATIRTHTLALIEDGRWYLLALGAPARLDRLRKAYPEFVGVPVDETPTEVKP